jgi:phage terminase small subunit
MKQRGRKLAASLAVAPVSEHEPVPVQPPPTLSEAAKEIFLDLVSSVDPAHFEHSDVGLLCQYCEAQAMAERSAAKLQNGDDPDALRTWEKANKVMSGLALRLRLGPQSRRDRAKVERPLTWDERFRLEHFGKL